MNRTQFLIARFWNKEISETELTELKRLLNDDGEFRSVLKEKFLFEVEQRANVREKKISSLSSKRLSKIGEGKSVVLKWLAVAALVVIFAGTTYLILTSHKETKSKPVTATMQNRIKLIENTTSGIFRVELPDRSEVHLSANSSISYLTESFDGKRRLRLKGRGTFKVKADRYNPFSVVVGDITVTALGTEFTVEEEKDFLNVQLLHGKVEVQIRMANADIERVYLKPGESVKINLEKNTFRLKEKKNVTKILPEIKSNGTKNDRMDGGMNFRHESIFSVFDKLSKRFGVKIIYDQALIGNRYFTGKILSSDDLTTILTLITEMNNLSYKSDGKNFIIQKD